MSDPYVPSSQKGAFGNGLVWVLGILVVVLLVAAIVGVVRWVSAPARGKLQAREQIQSGASRIAAYNHFFDLCASVQTDESRLDAQQAELSTATGDDAARVRANVAGITADRAEAINEYNADARKDYTVGQFRASRLPYQLPTGPYDKENPTSCGS